MYKIVFKVTSPFRDARGLRAVKRAGFVPYMSKRNGDVEIYATLFKSNDMEELREALTEVAYFLGKEGRSGGQDFATVFKVNDSYLGKGVGGVLGATIGFKIGGLPGLFLGALGGLLFGEFLDIEMNESYVGVYPCPISIEV